MPEERVIQTEASADLATHKILVEGEELSSVYQVLNIVVEKELNRIPWAKIILLDGDPSAQDFALSNEEYFVPGKEIEIKAGYHSQEQPIFKGIVIRHNLKIRSTGAVLIVECRDKAVKLSVGRKNKYFYESKDSEIIEMILSGYDLEAEVDESNVEHLEMVQYNICDWDFCIARAQANGKVCVVDDGKMSVINPDYSQEEGVSLVYGATILEFDAEMDARNQFNSIASCGWDQANQELYEMESDTQGVDLGGNVSSAELASVIGLDKLELRDGSAFTDAGLQEWANAKSLFNQLSKIRGRVKFQGVPNVKPNTTINLAGVGDRFNGKAYVSGVKHQITDGNWLIDAQFGINPKWFTEEVDVNTKPASGLLGAVNGLHVAIVSQLEEDPAGEYRVLIKMPIVDNESQGVWARVATLDAGDNRGSFFRPEIGDEVIVGFLNDNPNDPVILGMLHSSAKPAPIEPADDNHEKGFITREQLKLMFNDDLRSIELETPNGNKITLSDYEGVIEVVDEMAIKLHLIQKE